MSALVIEDVEDKGDVICVRARTRDGSVTCPGCGAGTARVHEYRERTAADAPVGGRRVVVLVRVRRMRCPALDCKVQTFREQVPGVLDRCQRRISRLTAQVSAVARELAGRASARLLPALGIVVSRHTALRVLLKIPLPEVTVPRVPGIDDFALRRGLVYATVLIDAGTGRRVDVIPGRTAGAAGQWLRDHPGAEIVCRDGSGPYGTPTCGKSRKQSRKPPRPAAGRNATSPRTRSWNSSRTCRHAERSVTACPSWGTDTTRGAVCNPRFHARRPDVAEHGPDPGIGEDGVECGGEI